MARSHYYCPSPDIVSISSKFISNKYLSSSASISHPSWIWYSIYFCNSSFLRIVCNPITVSFTFWYSHWPCVISIRRKIIPLSQDIDVIGVPQEPSRSVYSLYITSISLDIIHSMILLYTIKSCDASNLLYRLPVPCSTSVVLIPPIHLSYWSIYLRRCLCMPTFFSQMSKVLIDWYSASTSPYSLQESTCAHVYTHLSQLGHVGSWCGLYRDWIRFVPSIFITCLNSHS